MLNNLAYHCQLKRDIILNKQNKNCIGTIGGDKNQFGSPHRHSLKSTLACVGVP